VADDQAPDLWQFAVVDRFVTVGLSISDGGERDGERLLDVWAEDGDHMVKVSLPWAAVRELADEALQDWLYDPSVGGPDEGEEDQGDREEREPVREVH
jgi:hypothetical protein